MSENQQTCGKGLADRSPLLAKIAELLTALSRNLEQHVPTLDLSDEHAKTEHDAYVHLAESYRVIGDQLSKTAAEMASYRSLPMARHDMKAMMAPGIVDAFEDFVRVETELAQVLEGMIAADRQMLAGMREARGARK
jgi:hypothetical protein